MTTELFTGRIRASEDAFLVWANDEVEAERYVMATLGEPEGVTEVARPDGTLVLLDRELEPKRVVVSLPAQAALKPVSAAPPA